MLRQIFSLHKSLHHDLQSKIMKQDDLQRYEVAKKQLFIQLIVPSNKSNHSNHTSGHPKNINTFTTSTTSPTPETTPQMEKWVKNLSSFSLTNAQVSLLAQRPNFTVAPKHPLWRIHCCCGASLPEPGAI